MQQVNVRDARRSFKALLDRVASGEEVVIVRRGEPVARLVPPGRGEKKLPLLRSFRAAQQVHGRPLSEEVLLARREEVL
jgi:prevent-host-death family protein